ncbi:carbon-nitrogen hydrolase family protein [Deinococcus sp.]|uniref:carbon-nitrogen hydrolase family protein n=1 Tax=Deinococcus sp. TaxID=47478 RepID=UPI003CC6D9C1
MSIIPVAAAAYQISRFAHWDEYEAKLSEFVVAGVAGGARLLALPEYASLELVSLLPAQLWDDVRVQLPLLQALLPGFLDVHARLSRQHGVYLLAASFPAEAAPGRFVNRAYFFAPDGSYKFQDKQMMTRFEAEEWGIEPGEGLHVFETELGRLGVNICYDAEFPHFAALQATAGMDILLVPSFTGSQHGYHRVRVGSMARALEHQVYAVHAPCLADAPWSYAIETAVGASAVYAPADNDLPETGVVARGEMNAPGWLHAALDLSLTAEVRRDGHVLNARDYPAAALRGAAGVDVVRL